MALEESDVDMYADAEDSTLTAQAKTVPELEQILAADAHKVCDWCTENRMVALDKIHAYYNLAKNSLSPRENVTSEKLLGVTLNHNLSW